MNSKSDSTNHNDSVTKPNDSKMSTSKEADKMNIKNSNGAEDKKASSSSSSDRSANNTGTPAADNVTAELKETNDKRTMSNNTLKQPASANSSTHTKGAQSTNAEKVTDSDSLINPSVIKTSSTGDNSSSLTTPKNHSNYGAFNSHRGPRRQVGHNTDFHANSDGHMGSNVESLSRTNLYIRGLSSTTTDEDLYNMCAKFGNILSTKAIQDKASGSCRGYGFVLFSASQSAQAAVKELTATGVQAQMARVSTHHEGHARHPYQMNHNNSQYQHHHHQYHHNNQTQQHQNHHGNNNHNSGNLNMMNNHSHNQSANHGNIADPTNLYLANLPPNMDEAELEALLSNYGPVVSTRILRDEGYNPRGVGFARMESKDKCQEIIEKLNGKPYRGSREPLLVKFADNGNKKRHHHNNHNQQHHHHLNNSHHKHTNDEGRWREGGETVDQNISQTSYEHQRNMPHANQLADMSMIGPMSYSRMQPAFSPAMAASAAYPAALGPSTSAPQWIHPGSGQAWNVIPQIIQSNNLGPSTQGAVPSNYPYGPIPQLTNQMQGLQITHHSGPAMSGFVPQWPPVWSHHMPPPQQTPTQPVRPAAPIQSATTAQQQQHQQQQQQQQQQIPQVLTGATQTFTEVQDVPQTIASKKPNLSDTDKLINAPQ